MALKADITQWARELGFSQVGVADIELGRSEQDLAQWLAAGFHGQMDYMARHGQMRTRPAELVSGTVSVVCVRMDYWPEPSVHLAQAQLNKAGEAYVARYALGRDYHKVMRARLQKLADKMVQAVGEFGYRVFVDSAPVMEVALARKAGLGWRGKHTLLIDREAGSPFFLGEIYINLALPPDQAVAEHCGTCSKCMDVCPTQAIVAPYQVDARRCISYLTIEYKGSIPKELRALMGNRIYGCDDCQLACPWNRFARMTQEADFAVRNNLDASELAALFDWTQAQFQTRMAGSAILRIGHERWLRNIAVALGNFAKKAPLEARASAIAALQRRAGEGSELVREHVAWALGQYGIFD